MRPKRGTTDEQRGTERLGSNRGTVGSYALGDLASVLVLVTTVIKTER